MSEADRPFGIHTLGDMIGPGSVSTPKGRAVPLPYSGRRLLKAWWVLTGRAEAVVWPKPGDLEAAIWAKPRPAGWGEGGKGHE